MKFAFLDVESVYHRRRHWGTRWAMRRIGLSDGLHDMFCPCGVDMDCEPLDDPAVPQSVAVAV